MAKKNMLNLTALDNSGSKTVKATEPTEKASNVSPNPPTEEEGHTA